VHPAAEVQAQLHGRGAVIAEPVRGSGGEVQGDDKAVAQRAGHPGLGGQLLVLVPQAYQGVATGLVYRRIEMLDTGLVQRRQGATENILIDDLGTALPGDLQGRVRCVQIGRSIEQAQQ